MIRLTYLNEVFCVVDTDMYTKRKLMSLFSISEPGFYFNPRYQAGAWDGKRHLFLGTYMHIGLIPFVKKWAKINRVEVIDDTRLFPDNSEIEDMSEYIASLNLPFEPYEYQKESFERCVHFKKLAIFSPTSSGKSLVIYMLARYLQQRKRKANRVFIIVPTKKLVKQMYDDFAEYSVNDDWDVKDNCSRISSDFKKDFSKDIIITTYHSICNESLEFYKHMEGVILDECQGIQSYSDKKAKSLHRIFDGAVNSRYRFGFTGTPPEEPLPKTTILKYFANSYVATTYNELLEDGRISNFIINMLQINHFEERRGKAYRDELNFIYDNEYRNEFIKKLLLKNRGHNQLLLFLEVAKHSRVLYEELINDDRFKDFNVIILDKDSKMSEKEIKDTIANTDNVILLATYKLLGTGWSVKNLHHIIFTAPLKNKQTVLQSIGRGLRLLISGDKTCNIWDLVDKFSYDNVLYKQAKVRKHHYKEENFKVNYINMKRGNPEIKTKINNNVLIFGGMNEVLFDEC